MPDQTSGFEEFDEDEQSTDDTDQASESSDKLRFSVNLITQGKHRFYTVTMPSDVLARTCFVTTRDDDPQRGFQRVLDKTRALQIAEYIDKGLGTIPNSIVLSAQRESDIEIIGRGKTLQFKDTRKAFLILDGQHRVYGFSLAKTSLRVPVVIYSGLSRQDESRLFIDINTKQRPVPNELLLDIKSLAEYETDIEQLLRQIYDMFMSDPSSSLLGYLSPHEKANGKISRVTFNAGVKPLVTIFIGRPTDDIFDILNSYIHSFLVAFDEINLRQAITNPIIFRAIMLLFTDVAQRVQDKHGKSYTADNFAEVILPMCSRLKPSMLKNPGNSIKGVQSEMLKSLRANFSL